MGEKLTKEKKSPVKEGFRKNNFLHLTAPGDNEGSVWGKEKLGGIGYKGDSYPTVNQV
jgi:hypothetical protein